MWLLGKTDKASLQGYKTLVIHGHRFVIRKVNPWLDFRDDNMPQIFTAYVQRRKATEPTAPTEKQIRGLHEDVKSMIKAGLVSPALSESDKDGITVDDIMRDDDTASKLYWEIMIHSLNRFRGIKGVFFSVRLRYALSTSWRNAMANSHMSLPLNQEASV